MFMTELALALIWIVFVCTVLTLYRRCLEPRSGSADADIVRMRTALWLIRIAQRTAPANRDGIILHQHILTMAEHLETPDMERTWRYPRVNE